MVKIREREGRNVYGICGQTMKITLIQWDNN